MIIRQMSGETVQGEGRRCDPQRAAVPCPSGIVIALAGQIGSPDAPAFSQKKGGEKTFIGGPPSTDQLLCPCSERPSRSRAAEKHHELPAFHAMTSPAMASKFDGMLSASALPILRLMPSPYLPAC